MLHTPGGVLSAAESIIDYIRDLFDTNIRVIVPQLAMSAGTLVALSAKEILMGFHSSLGPIDPQFGIVSAHAVVEEFETAKREISEDPSCLELWKSIIAKYRPGFIGDCQKAIKWGDELARNLLSSGMFKEDGDSKEVIDRIIEGIADHGASKAHDRHFSAKKCAEFGLKISYLEDEKELQDAVLSVHHAAMYLASRIDVVKFIENQDGKNHVVRIQMQNR